MRDVRVWARLLGLRRAVVEDVRDPERSLLDAARLGDIHPPDRPGLERCGGVLDPCGQR